MKKSFDDDSFVSLLVYFKADFSFQVFPEAKTLSKGKWKTVGVLDYTKPVYLKLVVSNNNTVDLKNK